MGIVAVAFADEDPIYSIGGGPACFEEVLNRLEMTLGVLDTELDEAKHAMRSSPTRSGSPESDVPPAPSGDLVPAAKAPIPVEVVEAPDVKAGPVRVFLHAYERRGAMHTPLAMATRCCPPNASSALLRVSPRSLAQWA
jgi:hypothetical protein